MRQFLRCFSPAILILLFWSSPGLLKAQILIQDFETLTTIDQFASPSPNRGQVNSIRISSNDDSTFFDLEEVLGRKFLQLTKQSASTAYFLKNTNFNNPEVLLVQFELDVNEPDSIVSNNVDNDGILADIYLGDQLDDDAFFPNIAERFATLSINLDGRNAEGEAQFTVRNSRSAGGTTVTGETASLTTRSFIAAYFNNGSANFSYLGPDGQEQTIAPNTVDIWVDEVLSVNDAAVQNGAGAEQITSLKFLSRNSDVVALVELDNLLVEAVAPFQAPQTLSSAGGTFTVGTGGDFTNFTRPNGVFAALNELGSINGSFTFNIISDILNETGEVPLNALEGSSEENFIRIQPATSSRNYTVSGSVSLAEENALFYLFGADYVYIDGRGEGNTGTGLSADRNLIIRNSDTAPTILFGAGASNNYIGYSSIQGGSSEPGQGVIDINGEGGANSFNTFEYNRIGGYADVYPLNALASFSFNESANTNITVTGNEFYDFGAKGTNSDDFPSEIFIGVGSSDWVITGNHFYQEGNPSIAAGNYAFRGIRIQDGGNYTITDNYFGGSTRFAQGNPLTINSPDIKGNYATVQPLSYDASGEATFTNNTATNISLNGFPDVGEIVAFSTQITRGTVTFTDNTFYNISATTTGSTEKATGGYFIIPINFENRGFPVAGSILRNQIYDISVGGSVTSNGQGGSYIGIRAIRVTENVEVADINDNRISGLSSNVSNNLGAEINGIVLYGGAAETNILRNVICELSNNSTYTQQIASLDPLEIGSTGIYLGTSAPRTNVLIANNIISLSTPDENSASTLNGIYNKSTSNGTTKIYFNTIYFYGGDNQNVRVNYMVGRENFNPTILRNNILLNVRDTDDSGYLLYTRNLINYDSDYNLLYYQNASAGNLSGYGFTNSTAALSLAGWQQLTRSLRNPQDESSISEDVSGDFVNPACNLRIVQTIPASPVVDAGVVVPEVGTDIDGNIRVEPDLGASEAYNTWIGVVSDDWNTPGNWSTGNVPTCEAYNLLSIVPIGTQIFTDIVEFQPVIDVDDAVYRTIQIQNEAEVTIASTDALLQQCELASQQEANILGIYNRGTIEYTAPGTIGLRGVLQNDSTWNSPMGTFLLNGKFVQNLNSTDTLTVSELRVNGLGSKNLLTNLMVTDSLELLAGIVLSKEDTFLIAGPQAVTGGSPANTAYVDGPMLKMFDETSTGELTEFVFPTGDANQLGRAALQICASEPVTYRSEYFFANPETGGYVLDPAFYEEGIVEVTDHEYWEIARTEGSVEATIVLYYDGNSGLPEPDNIVISQYLLEAETDAGEGWTNQGQQAIEPASAPALGRIVSEACLTIADSALAVTFANTDAEVPLPVKMNFFVANQNGQNVVLTWQTETETNSDRFVIQRSLDGINWIERGQVTAAGNSQDTKDYSFTDVGVAKQYAGLVYYRLIQYDFDGAFETYGPLNVNLPNPDFEIQGVFPNPFSNNLVVNIIGAKDQKLSLKLLDIEGRVVASKEIFLNREESIEPAIQGAHLKPGVYILEVSSAEAVRQFKVVKD